MGNRNTVAGAVLVVIGILFLFGQGIDIGARLWPLFVIVPGLLLLAAAFLGKGRSAPLAVPGSIVTTIGLLLLVFSITDYWQAWAYCWTLIVAAAGLGTFLSGALTTDHQREREGLRTVTVGLGMFVAFGAFFEFLIWGDLGGVIRWVLPIALIAGGAYLLLKREDTKSPPGT